MCSGDVKSLLSTTLDARGKQRVTRSILPQSSVIGAEDLVGGEERTLTFFSAGSVTPSASLLRALRICEAATLVEVFSKACENCNVSDSRQVEVD